MNCWLLRTSRDRTRRTFFDERRATLNFETLGGEMNTDARRFEVCAVAAPQWSSSYERRYVVIENERKDVMSEEFRKQGRGESRVSEAPASSLERREQFESSGAIAAVVTTRSGDVTVRASQRGEIEVSLRAPTSAHVALLAEARVVFDERRQTLEIVTLPDGSARANGGLRAAMRGEWFGVTTSDLDVVVTMPEGSDLHVVTASGDTLVGVSLGDVKVTSASGDVVALDTCEALDVRTASGDVRAGHVLSRLRYKSASGDLRVASVAHKTDIASASGDVEITTTMPGELGVNSASGDVVVHVAAGLSVDVAGNTLSGRLGSEIDLSGSGDGAPDDHVSFIKINTVSGDILIDRARV